MALTIAWALAAAIGVAAVLDRPFAEPPERAHPVVFLGRVIAFSDRRWPASRSIGFAIALGLPFVAAAGAGLLVVGSWRLASAVGLSRSGALAVATLAAGVALFTAISLQRLLTTVRAVVRLTETDPDRARRELRALAGRDAEQLSPVQVRSAAVESAAENLADGLVAPLAAFVGGALIASVAAAAFDAVAVPVTSLALAAGGAMWLKAVNTLDSMLGYPHKPIGRAPAGLDDLVMWLPARLCAAALAVAAGDLGALGRARRPAQVPASPNSGWPMATLAAALRVELSKPDYYTLACGPALPTVDDAERGVRIVRRAGWLAIAVSGALAALVGGLSRGVIPWL